MRVDDHMAPMHSRFGHRHLTRTFAIQQNPFATPGTSLSEGPDPPCAAFDQSARGVAPTFINLLTRPERFQSSTYRFASLSNDTPCAALKIPSFQSAGGTLFVAMARFSVVSPITETTLLFSSRIETRPSSSAIATFFPWNEIEQGRCRSSVTTATNFPSRSKCCKRLFSRSQI